MVFNAEPSYPNELLGLDPIACYSTNRYLSEEIDFTNKLTNIEDWVIINKIKKQNKKAKKRNTFNPPNHRSMVK